jgi:hypothetical protein
MSIYACAADDLDDVLGLFGEAYHRGQLVR